MSIQMSDEMRKRIKEDIKGKVIKEMLWDDEGKYWVIEFTDGTEIVIRFMSEI